MMSQTNGVPTAIINNNKINNHETDANCDNELEFLQNLQTLVPAIKQNFILISQQFTQFMKYTENFNELSTTIRLMQLKHEKLERELEQFKDN
jgi:DNA-directed RNA polymerase beta subunit